MFNRSTRIIQILFLAIVMAFVSAFGFTSMVSAQADVCPQGGDWTNHFSVGAQSYTFNAPEGKVIIESCYKAGTTLRFATYDPGVESVTLTSDVLNPQENAFHDISHASFRLADAPVPTPPPPTATPPTATPPTPLPPTPIPPDPTPIPTEEPTPFPTPDPDPGDEPEPTPEEPEEQTVSTPAPEEAPVTGAASGPAALIIAAASSLGLSGLSLGIWFKRRNK